MKGHVNAIVGIVLTFAAVIGPVIGEAGEYQPFNGQWGYREIKVSADTYYVAYHGDYRFSPEEVSRWWAIRCAELCAKAGASHYVELAHVLEPLTEEERAVFLAWDRSSDPHLVPAMVVVIPIVIPTGSGASSVDAPSKMSGVRCISKSETITAKDRLSDVSQKVKEASEVGIKIRLQP